MTTAPVLLRRRHQPDESKVFRNLKMNVGAGEITVRPLTCKEPVEDPKAYHMSAREIPAIGMERKSRRYG